MNSVRIIYHTKKKQIVKEFYDTFGWHKNKNGVYNDTATFVDIRPVLNSYYHKTRMRVKRFLRPGGEYFLDLGSGAIPHSEYLEYSLGYNLRICIDFSKIALMEAKAKLGEQGSCILADVNMLPFKNGVFDGVVSLHVLYHLPEDEQESAVFELYRIMKSKSTCVIIYKNEWRKKIPGASIIWGRIMEHNSVHPPLYSHTHNLCWFLKRFPEDWNLRMLCWRSVDSVFTKIFVPNNFFGHFLLKMFFWLEKVFPHLLARIGTYPMIIIKKDMNKKQRLCLDNQSIL